MPTYAETAQTMLIEYMMIKGFMMFLGLILLGYGIWWIFERFKK